jgi:hypothetical protein
MSACINKEMFSPAVQCLLWNVNVTASVPMISSEDGITVPRNQRGKSVLLQSPVELEDVISFA